MSKVIDAVEKLIKVAIAVSLVLMVGLVFLNVALRYVFNDGLTWSSEVARYLFVWVIFLGSILAVKDHSHLGVDLVVKKLPLPVQKSLSVVSVVLIVGVMSLLVQGLLELIQLNVGMTGPATDIPINNYYYAGMISAVLMSLLFVYQAVMFIFFNKHAPTWSKLKDGEE